MTLKCTSQHGGGHPNPPQSNTHPDEENSVAKNSISQKRFRRRAPPSPPLCDSGRLGDAAEHTRLVSPSFHISRSREADERRNRPRICGVAPAASRRSGIAEPNETWTSVSSGYNVRVTVRVLPDTHHKTRLASGTFSSVLHLCVSPG